MLPIIPASFGDIVTAASLVHSICKALSDTMGASYDYQCLITELRYFEQALKVVDFAISAAPPTGSDALNIAAEIATCLNLLNTFYDRIRPYQKGLGDREHAPWIKKTYRKINWTLFKANEVDNFRRKISQHKQNIALFLHGLTM